MNVESTPAVGTGFAVVGAVAVEVEVVADVEAVVRVGGVGLDVGGALALPEPELQAASNTTHAVPTLRIPRTIASVRPHRGEVNRVADEGGPWTLARWVTDQVW